ncbi:MAG: ispE [Rhodospirillales bacterium]|jgi:4-diphosphocytidyl-2-C-methyl-D-erythritol kinase|nr:ispE [Rhodospirillales bacterium]
MVTAEAPAKINLYLHVTGKRADGYHLLDSLIAFAGIGDTIEAIHADTLALGCDGPFGAALVSSLGTEPDNLVLKAARLLAERADVEPKAQLRLTKRLPIASGIGGGSADAAATLHALCDLWGLALPERALTVLAAKLGADVPICLHGRAAYIGGIGEIIEPAPVLPEAGILLANPGQALSTPSVFKSFTGPMTAAQRFDAAPKDARDLARMLAERRNDLTDAAITLVPEIASMLQALEKLPGAHLARMSGSGATCFALFDDKDSAEQAAIQLAAEHPGWWVRGAALISGHR